MIGRAISLGVLTGAAVGILVMLGIVVTVDVTEYDLADLVAVLVIYLPMAFGVGAVTGLVEGLVAVVAMLALRTFVADRTPRARFVGAAAAAVPGLALVVGGVSLVVALPFTAVCAGGAAFWARRVVGTAR